MSKKGAAIFFLPILLIGLLSNSAFALSFKSENVNIEKVAIHSNSELLAGVKIANNGKKLDEAKVLVMIPELGIRSSGQNFDVNRRLSATVRLEEPNLHLNGYYARIVVSNDKVRRVKYRLII